MSLKAKLGRIRQIIKHRKLFNEIISSYLFFLRNPEKSVWGSITEEDEKGIKQAVAQACRYEGPIIEIGVLFGHTTNLIASLKGSSTPLVAVENFSWNPFYLPSNVHRTFTKRTIRYIIDHCSTRLFDGDSEAFYSENEGLRPSLIFIDAGHDYESAKQDIERAIATGSPVIAGHDYIDIHPGVIKAVDEAFGEDISTYGSVWIHERQCGEVRGAQA